MTATRADIVRTARSYIGTPFRHQGREPGVWLDCIGLVICACRENDIVTTDFDINGYARSPRDKSLLDGADQHLIRVPRSNISVGDLVALRWGERFAQHIGIVGDHPAGGLSLIHAYGHANGIGKVREEQLEPLMAYVVAAFALPGVE